MIAVERLVKHYRSGEETVRALDGVSLTVERGELVALYGPSGSGKTTLLTIAAALLAPDAGRVLVAGTDVAGLSRRAAARYRMRQVGYVAQNPDLLPGVPAIDQAALKLYGARLGVRAAHRRVAPLLDRLGLGDRLRHRPDQLSAGERQRVLIARALSTEPDLVLADEPTGSLDARRSRDVLALLTEICAERGCAMLLVTHDPDAAAHAARVLTLADGRLASAA
ncbi:MAG: ABC transporter ATP-binding protein [Solirubrobacterales bacterium]|nr:ABC transporter ATP-binding protein [Solirubrobacterales bacterium]